jgi:BMFP domain-containing protein YqiC
MGGNDMSKEEEFAMTDNQLKHLNRLYQFIRKLLKLAPQDMREDLEKEFDDILQANIES